MVIEEIFPNVVGKQLPEIGIYLQRTIHPWYRPVFAVKAGTTAGRPGRKRIETDQIDVNPRIHAAFYIPNVEPEYSFGGALCGSGPVIGRPVPICSVELHEQIIDERLYIEAGGDVLVIDVI